MQKWRLKHGWYLHGYIFIHKYVYEYIIIHVIWLLTNIKDSDQQFLIGTVITTKSKWSLKYRKTELLLTFRHAVNRSGHFLDAETGDWICSDPIWIYNRGLRIPHLYDLIMMGIRFMFHFPVYTTATDKNKRRMGWAKTNHMVSMIHIVENSFQLFNFDICDAGQYWCIKWSSYIVLPGCHVKVDSMSTHALKTYLAVKNLELHLLKDPLWSHMHHTFNCTYHNRLRSHKPPGATVIWHSTALAAWVYGAPGAPRLMSAWKWYPQNGNLMVINQYGILRNISYRLIHVNP